ncbi:hypothetical protein TRFO_11269 [Tritrichomonas foetus]|uniref:C2 domain-containing protein n=1 Tax=Tritrichomonas foetus TaxID=1144522 RepID=A0A1J4J946_9EUKA|nr:hypothetical protein TRFO_11269 [Tritrichomonas foetus]|eukprot:OHS94203.1 hypothetical protein TRFO_11269 [Tritrichomonas foetus]
MKLDIKIFAAKGLPKLNPKLRQMPFCDIRIEDVETSYQTKTSKNGTSPEWNEAFTFSQINPASVTIIISVCHKQQVISFINFTISDITSGSEIDQWLDLTKDNDEQSSGGKIHLALSFQSEPEDQIAPQFMEEEEEAQVEENIENNENYENQNSPVSSPEQNLSERQSARSAQQTGRSPGSPRLKADRTREKIMNDEEDVEIIENEALEVAQQKYNAFLKANAAGLLDNSKKVAQFNQQNDEE